MMVDLLQGLSFNLCLTSSPMKKPEVVIVDGFLSDPDRVRAIALNQEYHESDYHKGKRTPEQHLWTVRREDFSQLLHRDVTKWQEHGMNGRFQICVAGDTLVYHSDGQSFAAVLFLTPRAPVDCGLSLFRSREFGMRREPQDRPDLVHKMYGDRLLDRSAWEEVDRIGNVYNRLVIWDAKLVHSATGYFGHNLETGRLFQIFFFDAE